MGLNASGAELLQVAAERILARYLEEGGLEVARVTGDARTHDVDLAYTERGIRRGVKVKADPYAGSDLGKIADRSLPYYRGDAGVYALEAVANSSTHEPGWVLSAAADELLYYFLAIAQTEDEVRALCSEPDPVFFSELAVESDALFRFPMAELREWFALAYEQYPPRPVMQGGFASWCRLVPRGDMERAVAGTQSLGAVFATLKE